MTSKLFFFFTKNSIFKCIPVIRYKNRVLFFGDRKRWIQATSTSFSASQLGLFRQGCQHSYQDFPLTRQKIRSFFKEFSIIGKKLFFWHVTQHSFICRPSYSTVSEDAGIEPTTVATLALTARRSNRSANPQNENMLGLFDNINNLQYFTLLLENFVWLSEKI
jgi:hypothetical protein